MEYNIFRQPVRILVGLGFPAEIRTVKEAYALLNDWPSPRRNGAHTTTLNACRAALAREIDAETARATLVAFAKRQDLLAPESEGSIAARMTGRSDPMVASISH
jgi:hypothetical protein